MINVLFIAIGGAIGSVLRYVASGVFHNYSDGTFPWGTLGVNMAGSLIMGALWALFEHLPTPVSIRNFCLVGLLGAFTTFSTFSLENFHLLRDGEMKLVTYNIAISSIAGIIAVFAGYFFIRACLGQFK